MAYKIPWSNFHELNLDWLLQQVKELRTDVDGLIGSATPSDAAPAMDGAGTPGTAVTYSRGDHQHPTDTSRAAASDLTQEITDRGNADLALASDIADVDDKIKFSSAAPIMDSSSASAGFSDYMARADHIHPTDTSRASATDLAVLQARVDGFTGSALPSDLTPNMDGVGSAGTGGNYSRGDHVHPSDTSKLDKAGGTVTGDLIVEGNLVDDLKQLAFSLTNTGWYRIIECPVVYGTQLTILISKNAGDSLAEVHKIDLLVADTGILFCNETSKGPASVLIDRIRYTDAGMIDIHYNNNESNNLMVKIITCAPTKAQDKAIKMHSVEAVADAPLGEVVYYNYYFRPKVSASIIKLSFTQLANSWYSAADVALLNGYMAGNIYYLDLNLRNSLAAIPSGLGVFTPIAKVNVPTGYSLVQTDTILPTQTNIGDLLVEIEADGTIQVYNGTGVSIPASTFAREAIAVPLYNS